MNMLAVANANKYLTDYTATMEYLQKQDNSAAVWQCTKQMEGEE